MATPSTMMLGPQVHINISKNLIVVSLEWKYFLKKCRFITLNDWQVGASGSPLPRFDASFLYE